MAHVLYLQHVREWTESRLADILRSQGHTVEFRCPPEGDALPASASEVDAIIIGGNTVSTHEADTRPDVAAEIRLASSALETRTPYLGICFGAQALAEAVGCGNAGRPDGIAEFGFYPIIPTEAGRELFAGLDHVFQSHYAACLTVPPGAELLASSEHFEVQAFRIGERAYGLQFHPDAREDMIPNWYAGNSYLHGRPGVHLLDQQVADAERHERSIHEWCERFMAHWLEPAV
ncbi:MAG: glutamine amidotransferase [Actinomycetota bacterium]